MESQQTRKLKYISLNVLLHGIEFLLGIESLLEASCKNLRNGGTPNKENKIPWLGSTSSWGIFFCLGKKHFCEGAQRAKRLKLLKSREATGNEKKNRNVSFPLQNCSEAAFLRFSRSPVPIRNIRNAATLLQGMARRVAPWQMWRSSGG
ncbi:hypothetical protein [Delftia tsuruhatensis]|uniref:hypothetical protein n=1 Tax=Delftia tsuruhatensis TaxID=180282 RepID=UPI0030D60923